MGLLDGKTILITGAGRGIGKVHAIAFAEQGANVVVNDLGADLGGEGINKAVADAVVDEIKAAGGSAIAHYGDIANWDQAGEMIERTIREFGQLDGLVNNAGNWRRQALADLSEADFDSLTRVHLKGTFACTVHACRYWRDRHAQGERVRGSVVNTFSEVVLVGLPNYIAYGAAKAGILHLTITGSREAAAYGVRINAYGPRAVTRMMPGYVEGMENSDPPHPLDPRNSSPLVAWLLSDDSAHVTGQAFQTVGGSVARCRPWAGESLVYPPEGKPRFDYDEIGAVLNARIFGSRFPDLAMV